MASSAQWLTFTKPFCGIALSLLMATVMCYGLCLPASATNSASEEKMVPATEMIGCLKSPEGDVELIVGRLVETQTIDALGLNGDDLAATYEFNLYSDGTSLTGVAEHKNTVSGSDNTYSAKITLTIYYNVDESVYPYTYKLTRVSGNWRVTDSKATVTSAHVTSVCKDQNNPNQEDVREVSNNFDFNTGFTSYIAKETLSNYLGATLTLDFLMGTSRTYSGVFSNILFNVTTSPV